MESAAAELPQCRWLSVNLDISPLDQRKKTFFMQRICGINGAAKIYHETVPAQQNANLNSSRPLFFPQRVTFNTKQGYIRLIQWIFAQLLRTDCMPKYPEDWFP